MKKSFTPVLWGTAIVLLLLISIIIRLPFMSHADTWWRAQQTLLTTYWYVHEGITSLLHYPTPLFGPPFEVPFEFPIVQALSALLSRSGLVPDITLASQIVALAGFYACASLLFLLCRRFLGLDISLLVLVAFIFSPYMVHWSIEPLIDYPALALALLYLYCFSVWLEARRRRWPALVLGMLIGILGQAVKGNTMIIVIPPAAFMILDSLIGEDSTARRLNVRQLATQFWEKRWLLLGVFAYFVLPLAAGYTWTRFCDAIKLQSPFTVWLVSTNLGDWFFGSWQQHLSLVEWLARIIRVFMYFFPNIFLLFPLFFAAELRDLPAKARWFLIMILAGLALPVMVFMNLYQHDYYYITLSAYAAVILGVGLHFCLERVFQRRTWLIAAFICLLGVGVASGIAGQHNDIQKRNKPNDQTATWVENNRALIPPEGYVISVQSDWYPGPLYLLGRKGTVLTPREVGLDYCPELRKTPGYSVIVTYPFDPQPKLIAGVLSCYNDQTQELAPGIYRILQ